MSARKTFTTWVNKRHRVYLCSSFKTFLIPPCNEFYSIASQFEQLFEGGGVGWGGVGSRSGWEQCVVLDRGLEFGNLISNLIPTLLSCLTLDGSRGSLWTPALSSWAMQGCHWWFPQCLLFEPVDWVPSRCPSCCVHLLFHDDEEASGTACQWIWLHKALVAGGAGRRIQIHFMLAFPSLQLSLLPALASHFLPLSFSCLSVPSYSSLLPSPSRLSIGNHQIVSVTMSSAAAKALVIIPATQSKRLGEKWRFPAQVQSFLNCGLADFFI